MPTPSTGRQSTKAMTDVDFLFGLPLHPLVVHAAVVLLPLAAAGVIVVALAPKLRARYAGLVVVLSALALGVMPIAQESGEGLMEYVDFTEATTQHVELGESGVAAGFAVFLSSLALWFLQRRMRGGRRVKPWLRNGVAAIAIVASLGATFQIARIGHTGATSVWEEVGSYSQG